MVYGSIVDLFYQWEYLGLFDFVLPFLLVFALVYGVLSSTRFMGENKPVYIIVSLVVGFMSLRYRYFFSDFISELFPRLGVGLAVVLTILILTGMFIAKDQRRYWGYAFAGVAVLVLLMVFYQTFTNLGWFRSGDFSSELIGTVVLVVLVGAIIVAMTMSNPNREKKDGNTIHLPGVGWDKD